MRRHRLPKFYQALPKHKVELVDGRMLLAGSLEKTAMMMACIIEGYGTKFVAKLVPKDLLAEAVRQVWGGGKKRPRKLADFGEVESYFPCTHFASELRMDFFRQEGLDAWGGGMAIKLGEDCFMPDIYLVKWENQHRQKEYYFDGAPDLIVEVPVPYMRKFDREVRLRRYAEFGVPEVWWVEFYEKTLHPLVLENGGYRLVEVKGATYESVTIPGVKIFIDKAFLYTDEPWMHFKESVEVKLPQPPGRPQRTMGSRRKDEVGGLPFKPRIALEPTPMTFAEFVSWGGEVKFEYGDGKPIFGGGTHTTKEYLGMCMQTLGLKEAVKYLPAEEWEKVIAG